MSRRVQRTYDRWRDLDGTYVRVGARVEQTEIDACMGALRSRLYRRGQVTSRGATPLVVCIESEDQTVRGRTVVRVVDGDGDCGGD